MASIDIGGSSPSTAQSTPINFTVSAANKVYELIKDEDNFDLKLRVYITGGGCSGFQYGFTFDEAVQEGDTIIEQQVEEDSDDGGSAVQLLIDPMSFQYLTGSEIDFTDDVSGAQFVIRNPNAKTTCGCGSSFSI